MNVDKNKYKKGFTLIELLVVVTILSILAVITLSQFQTAQKKARDAQRKADLLNVSKALSAYFADYGVFPDAAPNGDIIVGTNFITWGDEFSTDERLYMKKLPKEKYSDYNHYCYTVSADKKKMGIFSILENSEDKDYNKMNPGDNYNVCGNGGQLYNFGIISPNATISDFLR